jgi:hypothetical protein
MVGSKTALQSLESKWSILAGIVFLVLVADSIYAVTTLLRDDKSSSQTPMLSEAILSVEYAREIFVLGLMGAVFLSQRCNDTAANVVCWLWVLSFVNLKNDDVHKIYASAAALLTWLLIWLTPRTTISLFTKIVTSVIALGFTLVFVTVKADRSHWFVLEYFAILALIYGMFLRIRSGCRVGVVEDVDALACVKCKNV